MLSSEYRSEFLKVYGYALLLIVLSGFVYYRWMWLPANANIIRESLSFQKVLGQVQALSNQKVSPGHDAAWVSGFSLSQDKVKLVFSKLVSHSNLQVDELRFLNQKKENWANKMRITLRLRGNFNTVFSLLVSLADSPIIYRIEQIDISHNKQGLVLSMPGSLFYR